ncbi:hypothetical protein D4764_12G0000310 [Takifugu flavidus]|uniref:Reverse transcriptase domain-containing protein n=1 Tax=Takifugu flavidus TaxID=433684 RepID=A0A5C6PD33_9TELE|nr:hypothetical protein D4764_12G0000310 [Takifugu flavidus]
MRISTSKSESMVLARKKVECLLRVGEEVLPQVEEFKYLGILFTSEGGMEREIDRRIGAASAVMRALNRSVVVKKELSRKAKFSIYRSIYVPVLTYGRQRWVMTERTRSRTQAAEMSFLPRVAGLSLRDRVRSSDIREGLGVEPLLLHIERSRGFVAGPGLAGTWFLTDLLLSSSSLHNEPLQSIISFLPTDTRTLWGLQQLLQTAKLVQWA